MSSRKKQKLPPDRSENQLAYRVAQRQEGDGDGLPIILATESPVRVYDWQERTVMDEILLMRGIEMPQQVPLLNSHQRDEARDVIGSIRDLEVRGDELLGRAYFASNVDAQAIRELYDEGHLTDFSIGFEPTKVTRVGRDSK